MEIKKEIIVTLTVKDLEKIIKDHFLKEKNIEIDLIYFNVSGHNREDDWRAEYPLDYELDDVRCTGKEKIDDDTRLLKSY